MSGPALRTLRRAVGHVAVVTAAILTGLTAHSDPALAAARDPYPKDRGVDALHYAFRLELSDTTDRIVGELTLDARAVVAGVTTLRLDLINAGAAHGDRGMTVLGVSAGGRALRYRHEDDALLITLDPAPAAGQRFRVTVRYAGIPATGLKIAPNRYGDRTFFSDNWPDKARHWLPTIDHISDKATSEFIVTAPSHYQVVSNGLQVEVTDLPGGLRRTHWANGVPIAPWLYVLGVARFAMQRVDTFEGKAIETWVYAQDRDAGFYDFAVPTKAALAFYSDYVGPFAYERLANIQSNSVSGGMEAASAILYSEGSVSGRRDVRWRNVIIHEVAHQWFGNAVTEASWDDVWLSEGFATYFTLLFIEHAYGRDEFLRGLEDSRRRVLAFQAERPRYTIVHDNLQRMEDVTSSQTYQKGSWVLHMLRGVVGPDRFREGIRAYYRAHFNGHATTADFRRAMEEASGMDLGWFFDQWLYRPGQLQLDGSWRYDAASKQVRITLVQTQAVGGPIRMPLEVGVLLPGEAQPRISRVELTGGRQEFVLEAPAAPRDVTLDPNRWVLLEATFARRP